ncbi:uncharacterized protein B0I36DRAFT_315695 [Microdochium trichocladiopsis]|uniref:DSBA-like thioredoxin domain-containing protein n=1 Tax=Microdochium trichocladiopsis TaxID=1682393 RepID=A0A9P8YFR6_9PEZI|nr:uncharacterized protein B0I36DRAFT_315695 [Microdochium trichocladiopsis]KAH7038166.1 hypothetical protein B0I36DRAFT_315695 [Microdochium trichocladiopsis]
MTAEKSDAATSIGNGSGGRIECYVDIASFFSYIAVLQLVEMGDLLSQHGVQVDIYPVLLGAINAGSGNKPPWTVAAKAAYLAHDSNRAKRLVGLDPAHVQAPRDLFRAARTQSANRALTYISAHFPAETYRAAMLGLFAKFWTVTPGAQDDPEKDQAARDLTAAEKVGAALAELTLEEEEERDGISNEAATTTKKKEKENLFTSSQVEQIVQAAESGEYKARLKARTEEALARGAFGAPWFWITGANGKSKPVFGSDRWHAIFDILGLPYTKLALQPPRSGESKL